MLQIRLISILAVALSVLQPAFAADEVEKLELIEANPQQGFHFPYYLKWPAEPSVRQKSALLVETNNTGAIDDEFSVHLASARALASGQGVSPFVADRLRLPLLVPAFPRPKSQPETYTHALDRDTMLIRSGPLVRLDLQLLAMVDDARKRLEKKGVVVHEQFLMCGFSASGTFANRFAFMHPDRLLGVAVGGVNSFPMLPVREYRSSSLLYPVGIGDLSAIGAGPFDGETWRRLPQLVFMGAEDDNDAVKYDDAYSDQERDLIYSVVGERVHPDRWQAVQRIYLDEKANVTFVTYGGVGHWTNSRINQDVANFLQAILMGVEKTGT